LDLANREPRFTFEQESFGHLQTFIDKHHLSGRVDGILLDLGMSSPQLEDAKRGFSFQSDGPLDMRMDPAQSPTAAEWLNSAPEKDIVRVLFRYGEEKAARSIARAICTQRDEKPITSTRELAELVTGVLGRKFGGKNPATRTFQALRIFINREIEELDAVLPSTLDALAPGGRLCVISFHSLEDRRVKRFLRDNSRVDPALARLPVVPASAQPGLRLPTRAIRPSESEQDQNPRSRSATLRVGERC